MQWRLYDEYLFPWLVLNTIYVQMENPRQEVNGGE
jgi:hypothetical protein